MRAIGPTTWSSGAPSAPSQPHTFAVDGLVNEATVAPVPSVKLMTCPLVRPENLVSGRSPNGTTVSVLPVYAFHADAMYGSR